MCVCVCVCVIFKHIYIYVCVYVYIYIYIYIYMVASKRTYFHSEAISVDARKDSVDGTGLFALTYITLHSRRHVDAHIVLNQRSDAHMLPMMNHG